MSLILGTGALFAAFVLICLGRFVLNRGGAMPGRERFGPTEALAYAFTLLLAIGVSVLTNAVVLGGSADVLPQLAIALGVLAAACVVTFRVLRPFLSIAPAADEAPGTIPPRRAGRPTPSNGPARPLGGSKRRAA